MLKGVSYPRGHHIDDLVDLLDRNGIKYPEELDDLSFTLNKWATATRHNIDRCANIKSINKVLVLALNWHNEIESETITKVEI